MTEPYLLPPEQLHAMARTFGGETAYRVVGGGSMTFARWDQAASRLANGLAGAGVAPGDRVVLHLAPANHLRWLVSYAAIHRAGAVAIPLNPELTRPEVERTVAHADPAAAVVEAGTLPHYAGGRPGLLVATPAARPGADPLAGAPGPAPAGTRPWSELLSGDAHYAQVPRRPGDLADIVYTSGTTGHPKAVAVRFENASLVPFRRPTWSGDGWFHASPAHTFAGLAFTYTPMKLGSTGIYLPVFDAGTWIDTVESERPGSVFLVPAMATLLLDHPRFAGADLSSVQVCTVGSAPLAPAVLERLQERLPEALVSNNYGMTEAGSVYCLMPPGEAVRRPGSVGKPVPPAEIVCTDDEGRVVEAGTVGQVRLRIPGRPREYYGDPEATARTWVDGWLVTGDLGRVDEDGYLYIVGRSKDVIIRGGNNIHPTDVEHAVESHPAVLEVSVVGVGHPVLGEDVVAFVVLRPGARTTAEDLRAHTLERLARYKVPRRWYVVDDLPRNATGKVIKDRLRRRAEAEDPLEVTG